MCAAATAYLGAARLANRAALAASLRMHQRACADLPPLRATPDLSGARCEEILASPPSGDGGHWWVKVEKRGIGTTQARAAVARAVEIDPEAVGCAGHRDRHAWSVQWFSVPAELCEHPGPLRRAGAHGSMRVLELTASARPVTAHAVARLRWRVRLKGAGAAYVPAKAIADQLRLVGLPNRLRVESDLAGLGRLLLSGKHVPAAVMATRPDPLRLRLAAQADAFNRWVDARIADGLLTAVIEGDYVRTRDGRDSVVEDVDAWQPRVAAFEAAVCGPLIGVGCAAAAGAAAQRETAVLGDLTKLGSLHGARRALRIHPGRLALDPDGADLWLGCELPVDSYLDAVLFEMISGP